MPPPPPPSLEEAAGGASKKNSKNCRFRPLPLPPPPVEPSGVKGLTGEAAQSDDGARVNETFTASRNVETAASENGALVLVEREAVPSWPLDIAEAVALRGAGFEEKPKCSAEAVEEAGPDVNTPVTQWLGEAKAVRPGGASCSPNCERGVAEPKGADEANESPEEGLPEAVCPNVGAP